ncbi:hypothetical protein [Sulfitobacter sp. MF3-043]|uniref:hypothetical protein n=1 Tax=Sulfitobacter sediminivivens TaxID=3252902 RepID=UPI0036D96959
MQWIIENWLLVLVGGALIGMHLFGHGHGHGGKKSGHDYASHDDTKKCDRKTTNRTGENTDA